MAIRLLHCLKVFQWMQSKRIFFMFKKVEGIRTLECYLFNFTPGSFEEISVLQSCRGLNDVSSEIKLKSSK